MLNKKLKEKVECLQEDVETLRKGFNKVRKICNYIEIRYTRSRKKGIFIAIT